uniref:Uncharacterized protein n=1 Tax=Aegilops tauschii subsp. strangulata TaxID=200361 RepID=A0A453T6R9_AEGTS
MILILGSLDPVVRIDKIILRSVDSWCTLTRSQDFAWLLQLIIWRVLLPVYCTGYI